MRPYREKTDERFFFRSRPPGGALVPRPAAWVLGQQAKHHRTLDAAKTAARAVTALGLLALLFVHLQPAMALQAPPVPSDEKICDSAILSGPSSPPGGATTVPAGDNSALFPIQLPADTTYWFAPGTHTLGTSVFSQIQAGNNDVFTGAPGAVIDGQGINHFGMAGTGTGVTVEYLTLQDFAPPGSQGVVNVNGEDAWTVEFDTIQDNIPGPGMNYGSDAVISHNCIRRNGQYAFNGFSSTAPVSVRTGGPSNLTMTFNEMSYNNECNYENYPNFPITPPSGCPAPGTPGSCGCSGGGKFWANDGATVTNNYVHDNYNVGLWADTNNVGFNFSDNYVSNNFAEGIMYETDYNALVQDNIFVDNTWGLGESGVVTGFPESALYISESGSDSRVTGPYGTSLTITGNQFYDNWGAVVLWENADRYCSSVASTSTGYCTLVNALWTGQSTPVYCSTTGGDIQNTPYIDDCRWKTKNVQVSSNIFSFDPSHIGAGCTLAAFCGFNGIFSQAGSIYPFSPSGVGAFYVENNITFNQDNLFSGNTYCGPWNFDVLAQGNVDTWATWQGAPYSQDPGSTMNGPACSGLAPPPLPVMRGPVNRTVTIPIRIGRR